MKLKNKIVLMVLSALNLIVCISLIVFKIPDRIPAAFDAGERCVAMADKWVLVLPALCPAIFATVAIFFSSRKKLSYGFLTLFVLSLYENILFFTYYCLGENLKFGALIEIPLSLVIFVPISVIFLILAIKVKNVPYKTYPAFAFKSAKETEFIWKQTHFFARDAMFSTSFLMFIVTFVFSFFRLYLIELAVFAVLIALCVSTIYLHSKSLQKKYLEMKNRKDALKKKENPAKN